MEKKIAKNLMEEYTKFISTSEMIIEYYKNKNTTGLEKYFLAIEDWVEKKVSPDENKPLVIQAHEGVGKKTLLAQWMKYHQQKSKKTYDDLIIPHFAGTGGNNANHYYAIYKILISLREQFNISQKVEVLEKKLVHYFRYWLELSSRALIGKIVDDSTIILIFDGINMFTDPYTGEEANISLWLPQTFPDRIKVIITTEPGTLALNHLENIGCEIIQIEDEPLVLTSMINNQLSRPSYITNEFYKQKVIDTLNKKSQDVLRFSLYVKTYLTTLLPYPSDNIIDEGDIDKSEFAKIYNSIDFEKLETINDINQLNTFLLEYFSNKLMDSEKFKILMTALTITDKGLTEQELFELTKMSQKEWNYLLAVFKNFFMTYKDLWKITNEPFKKAVMKCYVENDASFLKKLHEDISDVLKKTPTSIRKLEEQSYHLYKCKNYFKLKEVVSNIENFLLLFNPNNKFELCRYWQILEQKGFDPSVEYSNAIEGFEIHYKPSSEDTFMIILQVSRFLKEFGDFETDITPEYRHPPIKGGIEIKDIGLRREIKKMGMFLAESWEDDDDKIDDLEEIEHELSKEFPDYSEVQLQELVKQIYESTLKKREEDARKKNALRTETLGDHHSALDSSLNGALGTEQGQKKSRKKIPAILNEIEGLNIDIPENRERFKAHFGLGVKKITQQPESHSLKEYYLDEKDLQPSQEQDPFDTEGSPRRSLKRSLTQIGSRILADEPKKETTHNFETIQDEPEGQFEIPAKMKDDKPPTYYYYKRWLWMMFPWVTLSYKMNYSRIIYECYSSATKYISVPDEREKTKQALKIAIEAKLKKQLILISKKDTEQESPVKSSKLINSATIKRKMLPPLTDSRTNNLAKELGNTTTTNKSLGLTDAKAALPKFSPGTVKNQNKREHQFFVTHEFFDTTNFNSSLNISKVDHITEGDNTMMDTALVNMSLLNKTKGNKTAIKEKSLFASEKKFEMSLQKSNEAVKTLLLPIYQDSVLVYSVKQVEELESKVQHLNVTLNDIVYKTKISAKKLKEASVLETNLSRSGAVDFSEKFELRAAEVNESIAKAESTKYEALRQKDRLQSIIHICEKNKKEDEVYIRSLNYLLTNFKKLIQWETQAEVADSQQAAELEKLAKKYAEAQDEKIQTYEVMIKHIKNEKMLTNKVDRKVGQAYQNLETSAHEAVDRLKNTMRVQNQKREEEKNRSQVQKDKLTTTKEQLQEMRDFMAKVENTIGSEGNDPKFQAFSDYVEKILDYEAGIYQVNRDIAKLKEEKQRQASYLETLRKAKTFQRNQDDSEKSPYDTIESKKDLQAILQAKKKKTDDLSRTIMSQTKLILDTQMIFSKICTDLNIKKSDINVESKVIPTTQIVEIVEEKLKALETQLGPEEFLKFKKSGLEMIIYNNGEQNKSLINLDKDHSLSSTRAREHVVVFKQGKRYLEVVNK